jgi:hypothetical protein
MEIFLVNDKVPRNGTACLIEKFLVQEAQYQARHIVGCRRNFSQKNSNKKRRFSSTSIPTRFTCSRNHPDIKNFNDAALLYGFVFCLKFIECKTRL